MVGLVAVILVAAGCGGGSGGSKPTTAKTGTATTPTSRDFRVGTVLANSVKKGLAGNIRANPKIYGAQPGTTIGFSTCEHKPNKLRYVCLFQLSNRRQLAYVYNVAPDGSTYRFVRALKP